MATMMPALSQGHHSQHRPMQQQHHQPLQQLQQQQHQHHQQHQQQHRQKQPPANAMLCSVHNKTRGPNNVEETYPGSRVYRCKPGSECKMPDQNPQLKSDGPTPPGNVMCQMHGKQRGPNNVEPCYPGAATWKCKPGNECKVSVAQRQPDANAPPGPVLCVMHQKTRGPNNVTETYPGSRVYRCREGSECKMPAMNDPMKVENNGPPQTCALHGKVRGPNNVMRSGDQWRCKPGSECKVSSGHNAGPGQPQQQQHLYQSPNGQQPIHPEGPTVCWAHQKKRSPNQLHQVQTPMGAQWECLPQFKCKGTTGAPAPAALSQLQSAASATGAPFPMTAAMPSGLTDQTYQMQMMLQNPMAGPMIGHIGALGPH